MQRSLHHQMISTGSGKNARKLLSSSTTQWYSLRCLRDTDYPLILSYFFKKKKFPWFPFNSPPRLDLSHPLLNLMVYLEWVGVVAVSQTYKPDYSIHRLEEIKEHAFFKGVDWVQVEMQKVCFTIFKHQIRLWDIFVYIIQYVPPLIPPRGEVNAADAFDIGNFDDDETKGIKLTEENQAIYKDFDLVVPSRWQHEITCKWAVSYKILENIQL